MPSPSDSTSLYRRHRPRSFGEVVGQEHVVRTLRNAIAQEKVHHAYLFVGSRGTGKTSLAKILASTLNCTNRSADMEACGECESCRAIAAGSSVDVIEMDAASNRSVEDVRELRERVAYAPIGGRWKVYILDEAHMLTKEAWNAFLKTLEEPPPNTVFVLATTEAHRVMETIADRCQRFDFQRPSIEQISEVLERVAGTEGIEVESGATAMIARSASGSFRDALGTLDQLVSFRGQQVGLDAVLELLGAADAELLFAAVDGVIAEDPKAVLLTVEKLAGSGRDPVQFARDLLAHLRHLLVIQTIGEVPQTFVVTAGDEVRLTAQAAAIGPAALVGTIDELAAALSDVREGDEARMAVEIALLKAARPDLDPSLERLLPRIERLEKSIGVGASTPIPAELEGDSHLDPPQAPPAADCRSQGEAGLSDLEKAGPAASEKDRQQPPEDAADPTAASPVAEEEKSLGTAGEAAAVQSAARDALSLTELAAIWPTVIDNLRQNAPALAASFEGARPVGLEGDGVTIGFPPALTFNKRKAEAPDKREQMSAALEATLGNRLRPIYVMLDGEEASAEEAQASQVDHEALVEKLKSEFNAEEVG